MDSFRMDSFRGRHLVERIFESMQLKEVNMAKDARDFILVNVLINRNTPNYIRPLDKDIEDIFDSRKNKAFRQGECIRWVLKDDYGKLIGRIAAFVNKAYKNKGDDFPVGGMGFFDCIHDLRASRLLFDKAKEWLIAKGMEAMDGPINFGERHQWWGLVTEGFQEPMYCMNYNPAYYQELFENYGFKVFFKQLCYGMDPKKELSAKQLERHARFVNDRHIKAIHINRQALDKFALDFATVYNKAWAGHGGLKEIKKEQALLMFKKSKPILDEKATWFTYYKEEPIAIFINLPDVNQWFKYLNGKFGWIDKIKFLWIKKTKPNKKLTGVVFGVVPQFQGMGVESYMIVETSKVFQSQTHYTEYEMQWLGDYHPKMLNFVENIGDVSITRVLTTYRLLFDSSKEYKRHPLIS